jgi:CHAT domain-containing protein
MPEPNARQMIQSVTSSGPGLVSAPGAAPPRAIGGQSSTVEIYFNLQIVEEVPDNPFADPEVMTLKPGDKIHLQASICDYGQPEQKGFKIRSAITLYLHCKGLPNTHISIDHQSHQAPREEIDNFTCQFEITVLDECPRGAAVFELFFIDEKKQKFSVTSLTRLVEGNITPVDKSLLEAVKVTLNAAPPEHVAILHIEMPQPDKYRLKGWNLRVDHLAIELPRIDEKIGLAEFVENAVAPNQVRGIIKSVSRRTSQDLLKWFQKLHQKHGEQLCLIIADHTDVEVPWEMIEFEQDKYLGAEAIVARWIPVQNYASWRELMIESQQYIGSIVAYLDHNEVTHTQVEQDALNAHLTNYYPDYTTLKTRLAQSLAGIGLVYLGCHGIFTYSKKHETAVGSLENPFNRISVVQLEDLKQQQGSRPLVFINACHSARLMRDSQGLYGLPEVALALLASGYLGTLGPVGSEYAAKMAKQLLEYGGNTPGGINPGDALRRIRAQAVEKLNQQDTPQNQLDFIYAFMYVFFGNPLAQLRLTLAEDGEGDN